MNPFKAYDVRGVYGIDVDQKFSFQLGYAFSHFIDQKGLLVGFDARMHSAELLDAFALGARSGGSLVHNAGLITTPALHYLQIKYGFSGGVMVTASHNPSEYHGFKLFNGSGGSVSYGKGLQAIESYIQNNPIEIPNKFPVLSVTFDKKLIEYIKFITAEFNSNFRKLKIVIDASNGSAGAIVQAAMGEIDVNAIFLNSQPDGTFPAHSPDPLDIKSHNLIASEVLRNEADFGALLDGDGDRVIFFDEKGQLINSNFTSCLIALSLLNNHPGSAIVHDLIASRVFPEIIAEAGGLPVRSRIGYTFLYDKMCESKAVFGSETSGHLYFRVNDNFYTESSIYGIVKLLIQKKISTLRISFQFANTRHVNGLEAQQSSRPDHQE